MKHPLIHSLRPVARRIALRQAFGRWAGQAAFASMLALPALILGAMVGLDRGWTIGLYLVVLGNLAFLQFIKAWTADPDLVAAARAVEAANPTLNSVIVTAAEQRPGPDGRFNLLQALLLDDAMAKARRARWEGAVPWHSMLKGHLWPSLVCVAFTVALFVVPLQKVGQVAKAKGASAAAAAANTKPLEVSPGDVELEQGSSLVVLARFNRLPKDARLVVLVPGQPERRVAMVRNLADPVFGGTVPNLTNSFAYRVESDVATSPDYKVTVFQYPELERSVADIEYPAYTGKAPRHVEDTRRVTAVEGSRLALSLQLTKPVTNAVLVSRSSNAASLRLVVSSNQPLASLPAMVLGLTNGATYDLHLADADGRTNRVRTPFTLEVAPNRPPELRLALPRGDIRPSALEEVSFSGTVSDDFGVLAFGMGLIRAGGEPELTSLGTNVAAILKQPFAHQVRLEELQAKPDDVFGWFLWADDIGPDGEVRRTNGDIFFGEVRPFEQVFREGDGSASESGESQGEQESGNPAVKLAQLQKQIITATWRLQGRKPAPKPRTSRFDPAIFQRAQFHAQPARTLGQLIEPPAPKARAKPKAGTPAASFEDDLKTIREAASDALEQARAMAENLPDPAKAAVASDAIAEMERSIELLDKAAKDPSALKDALAAQQSAYQKLLQLSPRESQVNRQKSRSQSQSSQSSPDQQQIDELDLEQAEDRYEKARQAQSPQDAERREQSQILNRLKELAQRQEEMNQRLKELQTALQAANDKDQEELRRELKRLQDEQRQNLADADELQQRMQRPENQERGAQSNAQQRLDQARERMQQAAEATSKGEVSQALAAGARAQQELKDLREDLRKQNARELDEAARQLRAEARDLARDQEQLRRDLSSQRASKPQEGPPSLASTNNAVSPTQALNERMARNRERLTNVVQRATQLSQQAEGAEPGLARQLEESVRDFALSETTDLKQMREQLIREGRMSNRLYQRMQDTANSDAKSLDMARDFLNQGMDASAREAASRSARNLDRLRQGIEKAAASVVGDDTEALRIAQQQLDSAAAAVEAELAQAEPQEGKGEGQDRAEGAEGSDRADRPNRPNGPNEPGGREVAANQGPTPGTPTPGMPTPGAPTPGAPTPGAPTPGAPTPGAPTAGAPTARPSRRANARPTGSSPITGSAYTEWSDQLREAEELLDSPALRAQVANARDEARRVRIEYTRGKEKPDWTQVQLQVVKPLVEVRDQIREELARRAADNPLVPLDRDPVPGRYSEMVRRYYEQLGRDK